MVTSQPSITNCPKLFAEYVLLVYVCLFFFTFAICLMLFQVAIAWGFHLFPFRTEKLSLTAPMVLRTSGRVGRRRFQWVLRRWKLPEDFFCMYSFLLLPSENMPSVFLLFFLFFFPFFSCFVSLCLSSFVLCYSRDVDLTDSSNYYRLNESFSYSLWHFRLQFYLLVFFLHLLFILNSATLLQI